MTRRTSVHLCYLALALLLAGCSMPSAKATPAAGQSPSQDRGALASPAEALPGAEAIAGWTRAGRAQRFDAENLYDLVDGQADAFFAYAFEEVATGDYENTGGQALRIEVWQLETPASAYGLFTTYRAGTPVPFGNEGDTDSGRRLDFWQDRYMVRLFALQELPDADLYAFAGEVAGALPAGGEPPTLLDLLPQDGLQQRTTVFFHEEISIQSYLWLGGENLLGLGPETHGLLARYDVGDGAATLLLVQYSDAQGAPAARDALQAAEVSDLVLAEAHQDLLAAVFGKVNVAQARALLMDTLNSDD